MGVAANKWPVAVLEDDGNHRLAALACVRERPIACAAPGHHVALVCRNAWPSQHASLLQRQTARPAQRDQHLALECASGKTLHALGLSDEVCVVVMTRLRCDAAAA